MRRTAMLIPLVGLMSWAVVANAGPFEDAAAAFARREYKAAADLLTPTARQGHAASQSLLGQMYDRGLGVLQDYQEAARWYEKAAEQGDEFALIAIGEMYESGRGVEPDLAKAIEWYGRAADKGIDGADDRATSALILLNALDDSDPWIKGKKAYAARRYDMAHKALRPLAEGGHAGAQNLLGIMYERGDGVPQDGPMAISWLERAIKQGYPEASYNLAIWLRSENPKRARQLLVDAAERGLPIAQLELGYAMGEVDLPKDVVSAHMWLNLAAAGGSQNAGDIRDELAKKMSSEQIAKAHQLARQWKPRR
jgi:uncharacterized protein